MTNILELKIGHRYKLATGQIVTIESSEHGVFRSKESVNGIFLGMWKSDGTCDMFMEQIPERNAKYRIVEEVK